MFTRGDLTEIKSLANPPVLVKETLENTLRILGYPKKEAQKWVKIRGAISNPEAFFAQCKEVDKDKITEEVKAEVRETVKNNSVERVKQVSKAASNVFLWNKSMVE